MPFFQIPDDSWRHGGWDLKNYDFDEIVAIHIHVEEKAPQIQVLGADGRWKHVVENSQTLTEAIGLVEQLCAKSLTPFFKLGRKGDWLNPKFADGWFLDNDAPIILYDGPRDTVGHPAIYLRPTHGFVDRQNAPYFPSMAGAREILHLIRTCKKDTGPEALP